MDAKSLKIYLLFERIVNCGQNHVKYFDRDLHFRKLGEVSEFETDKGMLLYWKWHYRM